jgi:protein-disulfide isomerase
MGKASRAANASKREQAAQSQRERRAKQTRVTVFGVIAALVVAGVIFTLFNSRGDQTAQIPNAASAADGYGIVFNPDATPVIDVWEDPQCPACKTFETASGEFISSIAREGRAKVVFHPLTFIGPESVIAANAMACASDAGKFLEFQTLMYASQPSGENTKAWDADAMVDLGSRAGISSPQFESCVRDRTYEGWTRNIAADGAKRNVNQTPTLWFNQREVERNAYLNPSALDAILKNLGMK